MDKYNPSFYTVQQAAEIISPIFQKGNFSYNDIHLDIVEKLQSPATQELGQAMIGIILTTSSSEMAKVALSFGDVARGLLDVAVNTASPEIAEVILSAGPEDLLPAMMSDMLFNALVYEKAEWMKKSLEILDSEIGISKGEDLYNIAQELSFITKEAIDLLGEKYEVPDELLHLWNNAIKTCVGAIAQGNKNAEDELWELEGVDWMLKKIEDPTQCIDAQTSFDLREIEGTSDYLINTAAKVRRKSLEDIATLTQNSVPKPKM